VTINNASLKPDIRHATRRLTAIVSRLPLIAVVACVVAVFASYALGLRKQGHADTSGSDKPAITRTLVATEGVDHLDRLAREAMVVEMSDGTLFVSGYDNNSEKSPGLWRSRDHGATWESVHVGSKADGAIGDSDVDLAVGPDDTPYFVAMTYDVKKLEGVRIAVGASKNAGAKWSWKVLSENRFDDRPWVGVAPDRTAHVIWNDGSGVRYAVSQDGGASWNLRPRIHEQGCSSHLAIGPHGEIAVRITPISASGNKFTPGVDLIAVSRDGGKTWQKHPAPGERDWSPDENKGTPRWVEPLAWDEDGALYSLWGSQEGLWLARSPDQGKTWTSWHIVDRAEVSYYPYLIARGHGELAATWSSDKDDNLRAHMATIRVGDGKAPPQVIESQPFQTDTWWQDHPTEPVHRTTGGEYIPIIFLRAGGFGVVTTIQNVREKRLGFRWWKFAER
jgi:hypothetical protein